jgi:hypothetical protein
MTRSLFDVANEILLDLSTSEDHCAFEEEAGPMDMFVPNHDSAGFTLKVEDEMYKVIIVPWGKAIF